MQINNDIEYGIELLKQAEDGGITQKHKSHIDYYIANGIKSRIALVQERWQDAVDAAVLALKKPDLKTANASELVGGFNDINMSSVLWGAKFRKVTRSVHTLHFFAIWMLWPACTDHMIANA